MKKRFLLLSVMIVMLSCTKKKDESYVQEETSGILNETKTYKTAINWDSVYLGSYDFEEDETNEALTKSNRYLEDLSDCLKKYKITSKPLNEFVLNSMYRKIDSALFYYEDNQNAYATNVELLKAEKKYAEIELKLRPKVDKFRNYHFYLIYGIILKKLEKIAESKLQFKKIITNVETFNDVNHLRRDVEEDYISSLLFLGQKDKALDYLNSIKGKKLTLENERIERLIKLISSKQSDYFFDKYFESKLIIEK